ncbi:hypothetical protein [Burkholderia ubonensis]|uniref:hypothetical protein n=1 Tax=Burkholderia ubonensis TaxID=101571 RepID=UPI000AEA6E65|nr:hypothetical protein [Burkholderia ubonensis]
MTTTPKFDHYVAFDTASKQVKQEMAGFLERMQRGHRRSGDHATGNQGQQHKGSHHKAGRTHKD